jgi:hypothetical protein
MCPSNTCVPNSETRGRSGIADRPARKALPRHVTATDPAYVGSVLYIGIPIVASGANHERRRRPRFPILRRKYPSRAPVYRETTMRLGLYLRELSRSRISVAFCAAIAVLAALFSVADVRLLPPAVKLRSLQMGSAYTELMVDTHRSALLDVRQSTYDISMLVNRAVLVGSLMATPSVRADIARRTHVPADALQIEAPRTPVQPLPRKVAGRSNGPADLFRTTNQYRLDVRADTTVPFLDIDAQAPTAIAASQLANGAVDGLEDYLRTVAASQRTPSTMHVEVRQFGRAQGRVITQGIQWQVAVLAFCIAFAAASAAAVAIGRIRRGWRLEAAPAAK